MRRWICVIKNNNGFEFEYLSSNGCDFILHKRNAMILDHPEISGGAKEFLKNVKYEIVPLGFNPNDRTNPSWKRKVERESGDDERGFADGLIHARLWIYNARKNGMKDSSIPGATSATSRDCEIFKLVCEEMERLLTKEINEHIVELAPDEKWVKIKFGAPVNTPAGGVVENALKAVSNIIKPEDDYKFELTKDDMPDHPRYAFDTEIAFMTDERGSQYISKLKPHELESACSIAYMHWMDRYFKGGNGGLPIELSPSGIANKWLSIVKPKLVWLKDFNGWSFKLNGKTLYVSGENLPDITVTDKVTGKTYEAKEIWKEAWFEQRMVE